MAETEKMQQPSPPARKSGRGLVVLLRLIGLVAMGAGWWYLFHKEAALPAHSTSVATQTDVSASDENLTERDSPVATQQTQDAAEPTDTTTAESADSGDKTPDEPVDPIAMQWDAIASAITDAVVNQAYPEALALTIAAEQTPHPADFKAKLVELEGTLRELPEMDHLVMAGLTRAMGQEIFLLHNGKPRRLIVRAVSDNAMSAVAVRATGEVDEKHPITIKASALDPKDKLKWLGDASTASRAMMKCLLHRQSGNTDQAKDYAAKSGPLAGQLIAWIDAAPAEEESAPATEEEPAP